VKINGLAFTYNERVQFYTRLMNEFNRYAEKNNLNIKFQLTTLTPNNSTSYLNNYSNMIENLLFRNSVKYDIYFYYGSYTEKYGPYFVNLEKYLSKEHIEKFDKDVIKNVCLYNNVIVGLVNIIFATFYYKLDKIK